MTLRPVPTAVAVMVAVALGACASLKPVPVLTVDELVSQAEALKGHSVVIRGLVSYYAQHGSANFWASAEALADVSEGYVPPDSPARKRCVSLDFDPALRARLAQRDGLTAKIRGDLVILRLEPGEIDLDGCSEITVIVRSIR